MRRLFVLMQGPDEGRDTSARVARMLAQRVGDFVTHDGSNFVVGQCQFVDQRTIERDLATRHAKRVDLVGANQIHFPRPIFGARIPLQREWDEFF